MTRMTIAGKLWLLAGSLLCLTLCLAAFGLWNAGQSRALTQRAIQLGTHVSSAVDAARSAQVNFKIQVQEWKNILLRGADRASFDRHFESFRRYEADTQRQLQRLSELAGPLGIPTAAVEAAMKAHASLGPRYRDALGEEQPGSAGFATTVDTKVRGIDREPTKAIDDIVALVLQRSAALEVELAEVSDAKARQGMVVSGLAVLLAVVLSVIVSALVIRAVTRPLDAAVAAMDRIAEGQLDIAVPPGGRDELGRLLTSLGRMQSSLRETVTQVVDASQRVTAAAGQVAAASSQIDAGARAQSEATSSTATAVEQVTVSIAHVADHAQDAANVAEQASGLAREGQSVVRNASCEMRAIAAAAQDHCRQVQLLNEHAGRIGKIIGVIREIADQTNLLALNAAIEAARAGEHGRGFALVADEVRKLAARTGTATAEIVPMIQAIQTGTAEVAQAMLGGGEQVGQGVRLADEAAAALERINAQTRDALAAVSGIASASREQREASAQIARNIERIAQMTEEAGATVSQTACAANALVELANGLSSSVSRFRV